MEANGSVPSTLWEAGLSYGVRLVRCTKCIFDFWYIQLTMGLSGCNLIIRKYRGASVFSNGSESKIHTKKDT